MVAILLGFFLFLLFNVVSMSIQCRLLLKIWNSNVSSQTKELIKKINKDFSIKEIDNYLGEYIKDRAIKRGETTTTVMKRVDSWKSVG